MEIPPLSGYFSLEVQSALESYCESWARKCGQRSTIFSRGTTGEDIDLDGFGLRFVERFRNAANAAHAQGKSVDPKHIEGLILVLRNDVMHRETYVSRAAMVELMACLERWPFVQLKNHSTESETSSQSVAENVPYILTCKASAWLPLEE